MDQAFLEQLLNNNYKPEIKIDPKAVEKSIIQKYEFNIKIASSKKEVMKFDYKFFDEYCGRKEFDLKGYNEFRRALIDINDLEEAKKYALENFNKYYKF